MPDQVRHDEVDKPRYTASMPPLVTPAWLADNLTTRDLRVLDCTYLDSALGRDARAEHDAGHIPGAQFLDLKDVSDPDTNLPTMLPSARRFAAKIGTLGIGTRSRVVLYDNSPWRTAARAWFMFRSFGFYTTAILDGGFANWREQGQPTTAAEQAAPPVPLTIRTQRKGARTIEDVWDAMLHATEQIVDARSATRFSGEEADPRPGVAPGHIPGSYNLPYTRLFNSDGNYKDAAGLMQAFADAGIDPARPLVATCGSGITASTVAFAAHLLGNEIAVYDGSWSEWGADPSTPKATA